MELSLTIAIRPLGLTLLICAFPVGELCAVPAPHMISEWGKGIFDTLFLVEKLASDPGHSAEYGGEAMGAMIGGGIGTGLGTLGAKGIGADGVGKGILGFLGGVAGASIGSQIGKAKGAKVDTARNFLIKDKELLTKIDWQLTELQDRVVVGSDQAIEISELDNEVRSELPEITEYEAEWANWGAADKVRQLMPEWKKKVEMLTVKTDRLTAEIEGR